MHDQKGFSAVRLAHSSLSQPNFKIHENFHLRLPIPSLSRRQQQHRRQRNNGYVCPSSPSCASGGLVSLLGCFFVARLRERLVETSTLRSKSCRKTEVQRACFDHGLTMRFPHYIQVSISTLITFAARTARRPRAIMSISSCS